MIRGKDAASDERGWTRSPRAVGKPRRASRLPGSPPDRASDDSGCTGRASSTIPDIVLAPCCYPPGPLYPPKIESTAALTLCPVARAPSLGPRCQGRIARTPPAGPLPAGGPRDRRACSNGPMAKNVLGGDLEPCSFDPLTGFYRNGCCTTGADDTGAHVVCARVTPAFLEYSKQAGNDLTAPQPGSAVSSQETGGACAPPVGRRRSRRAWHLRSCSRRPTSGPWNGSTWTICVATRRPKGPSSGRRAGEVLRRRAGRPITPG